MQQDNSSLIVQSAVTTRYVVMPHQANPNGTAFGGAILSWIDVVASMAAQKYCRRAVATAQIDSVSFLTPIEIGDHVILKATVNYTGNTSLEVGVIVFREDPLTGQRQKATRAYLTFVAFDENSKPIQVEKILPQTPDELRRFDQAKKRVALRKQNRAERGL